MPSRVNSSFFTRIRMGSLMNFFVTSRTSAGIVADRRTTCTHNGLYSSVPHIKDYCTAAHRLTCWVDVNSRIIATPTYGRTNLKISPKQWRTPTPPMHLDVWFTTMTHRFVQQAHRSGSQQILSSEIQKAFLPECCSTTSEISRRFGPWILDSAFHQPRRAQTFWCFWTLQNIPDRFLQQGENNKWPSACQWHSVNKFI